MALHTAFMNTNSAISIWWKISSIINCMPVRESDKLGRFMLPRGVRREREGNSLENVRVLKDTIGAAEELGYSRDRPTCCAPGHLLRSGRNLRVKGLLNGERTPCHRTVRQDFNGGKMDELHFSL